MNFRLNHQNTFFCDLGQFVVEISDFISHGPRGWSIIIRPTSWTSLGTGIETSEQAIETARILVPQFLREQIRCSEEALEQVLASRKKGTKRKHALERLVESDGTF